MKSVLDKTRREFKVADDGPQSQCPGVTYAGVGQKVW